MAYVASTVGESATAIASIYTHPCNRRDVTVRIGSVCAFLEPGEARELARQIVAMCDTIEVESIANAGKNGA